MLERYEDRSDLGPLYRTVGVIEAVKRYRLGRPRLGATGLYEALLPLYVIRGRGGAPPRLRVERPRFGRVLEQADVLSGRLVVRYPERGPH